MSMPRQGNRQNNNIRIYRVSIKSFPDYKLLLQEKCVEYKLFFSKCNSTQEVFRKELK